ncbi:hypothetical protein LX36DRAFT_701765 [Colletotrichum falcatum]|nr:hypothetical protein LX36DRAFT_701765 [Colletotrichum falcatum]
MKEPRDLVFVLLSANSRFLLPSPCKSRMRRRSWLPTRGVGGAKLRRQTLKPSVPENPHLGVSGAAGGGCPGLAAGTRPSWETGCFQKLGGAMRTGAPVLGTSPLRCHMPGTELGVEEALTPGPRLESEWGSCSLRFRVWSSLGFKCWGSEGARRSPRGAECQGLLPDGCAAWSLPPAPSFLDISSHTKTHGDFDPALHRPTEDPIHPLQHPCLNVFVVRFL